MKYFGSTLLDPNLDYTRVSLYKTNIYDRLTRSVILQNILNAYSPNSSFFDSESLFKGLKQFNGIWDDYYDFGHVYFLKENDALMFILKWS